MNLSITPLRNRNNGYLPKPKAKKSKPKCASFKGTNLPLKNSFKMALKELLENTGAMPKEGYFKPIKVNFKNKDEDLFLGNINLLAIKSTDETNPKHPSRRYLKLEISNPDESIKQERIILKGTKEELQEALKKGTLIDTCYHFAKKSSSCFIDKLINQ